ncbi:proliferation marker protein Ki-67 isoform X2 [Carcharodon carcharias]|uniref:proliferation marker protein Ki-67 isoform X2 n=1 Tax=Carcharodon carcharias TaxID=13397 RepID=UPI001B7EA1EC|nr:proliferation marker protein Ki-67 isoform X2 [Carcharodon carcharias]
MPLYGKVIVIKRTGADGYNFPLTSSSCLFGRKADCDIRIQLPHVSKEHCKLEVNENNEIILTNLSEVNQTHLNGKVVLHSERLKHLDVFTVIDRSFRFEYPLDSVHNTSPRKRRSLSSLKNETLQVLHVQQGVDDGSQPSGKARRSASGQKPDKLDVDKIFKAATKSANATPNERDDSPPKHLRKRSSTKILNDEQLADEEYLSPFSKLYEIFKQEVAKPIQNKPNEINMHVPVNESSTDLTKQTSVPGKKSDAAVSQYVKNPRTSLSARRMSGRSSNITLKEGKIEKDCDYDKMNNSDTLLIEGIATADLAKPTANISSPKKNILMELNKFTENAPSEATVTSPRFSDVGVKGKEQNNYLCSKCTPKTKQKCQHFTARKSLTVGEVVKKPQEILEPSVEKEPKTVEVEQSPVNDGKERAKTPKKHGRSSLRNKNAEPADSQSEQVESTNVSELSAAKSEVKDESVEMEHTAANVGREQAETPKKRGRSSLRNKSAEPADIQSKLLESTNVSEPSAAKSEVKDKSVEMEHTAANVGREQAETPKKRGRSSLRNKSAEPADIQSEQVESTNVSEPSAAKSELKDKSVEMEHTAANVGREQAETSKKRGRSSFRNKSAEPADIQSEQVESTNVSELSAAKSELKDKSVEMEHTAANVGREWAETPKKRGRSSLCNKNAEPADIQSERVESTNVSEPSAAKSELKDKSVEMEHTAANVGREQAETPKKRGRSSLRNKSAEPADIQSEQVESTNVSEPSAARSELKDKSIEMEHTAANVGREWAETPKKRGRSSLRNKNAEPADIQSERVESTNVSEPSAAKSELKDKSVEMEHTAANVSRERAETPKKRGRSSLRNKNEEPADMQTESAEVLESSASKSPALVKQKSGTSPSSVHLLRESDAPYYPTKAERLKRKSWASKSPLDSNGEKTEKIVAGGDHIHPMNTATVQLETFSSVDIELNHYTSSKESTSSPAVTSYLSKKRRSENEENFYGPSFKRKRVSFGANLSPEVFDKRMPPSSPLRKGGTPTREFGELNEYHPSPTKSSIPSAKTSPRQTKKSPAKVPSPGKRFLSTTGVNPPATRSPLVKMPASTKAPSLLDVKQSPDAKTPLPTKTPSLPSSKRSPAARTPLQNKTPSASKKSSIAKTLPTLSPSKLVANKTPSPIAGGSFDCSPRVRGRFSITHVATPPHLTRSKSPRLAPAPLNLVLFEQPQQNASLVASSRKKPSRKSTRRSGSLFAAVRSRRQAGASAANLLVTKSWAQIVKEGVARPQLRCARKKSAVVQKRTKNISSKVTPARSVKGHFSTGHAASPATIVIGKSQATTIRPTRQAPQVIRPVSLKRKDHEMEESFTGIAEMFSTPKNENDSAYPVLCTSNIVDNSQTALANPVTQKSFEDSVIKTPEETGVMTVSPLTTPGTRSNRKYNNSVSRLLRCRADFSASLNDLCESVPEVPKVKGKPVEDMDVVKRIMKTPKVKGKPVEDMAGVKRIMKTPRVKGKPVEDMAGVKRIMKTPKVKGKPVEDMVGVKRIMKTPKVKGKPVEDMIGVKRIMKTPKVKGKPVEDMVGVKRIMKTPKVKGKPVEDMVGVKRIMKTPKVKSKPVEDFTGLRMLMAEPKQKAESPEVSYVGIKNLFHPGKEVESCDYSGLSEMFSTAIKTEESSDFKLQQMSKTSASEEETNRPPTPLEKIYSDRQTMETSENKLSHIVKQHNEQPLTTKYPPRETGGNSSLPSDVQVTRKGQVQAKSVTSPSSKEECKQRPKQPEASQTVPEDKHVEFSKREITESKDEQAAVNKLTPTTRQSLKERTGADESPTTINATPNKNGCSIEFAEEVSKMASTRKSLTREKIDDDVKMSLMPNKTTGRKESPHEQSEEVIVLKPQRLLKEKDKIQKIELEELPVSTKGKKNYNVQDADVKMPLTPNKTTGKRESHEQNEGVIVLKPQTRGSLKDKGEFQNIPNVELKGLPSLIAKDTTSSKNESQGRTIEEINKLVSPIIKPSKGKMKVQNVQSNEMTELFTLGKTTPDMKGSQNGQINEVDEITSVKESLEAKKEAQNIQEVEVISPPTSAKTSTQDRKPIPVAQIEVVHTTLRERPQRRKKETENIQVTEVKKSPAVTKTSNVTQEKENVENVESGIMKNGCASPKTCIKDIEEVKDHPVEDAKVLTRIGRAQRRKNINIEETEAHKPPGTTNGYTRKRRDRCASVENIKESIGSQGSLRDQEEVAKAGVNSDPEQSERNGVKTENVKILAKKDLVSSKSRSARGRRGIKDLFLEEVSQDSVPAKRLRKEKELDEAPSKTVNWDSNIASSKVADCTVETLQEALNRTELPIFEKRSRRGKAAKKEVNLQVSPVSIETSRTAESEHTNSKGITDAYIPHESAEQKGRPKRNKTDVSRETQAFTKNDKYEDAENTNEGIPVMKKTNHTESVLKLSPTPIKRSLRGKGGQKVTQIKEEHVKELPSRNSKRNTRGQKLMATTGEEPHVSVRGALGKEDEHKMAMPSSRAMKKDKQTKELLVECEAVPEQQQCVATVDAQLDTASKQVLVQEIKPITQKGKSKVCQRAKASPKGAVACLSNVDIAVGGMAVQEKRRHLNVSGSSEVVDYSEIPSNTQAMKRTGDAEVTSSTKKMDVTSHEYEIKENTRPKRGVGKGRSAKTATESEMESLVIDTAEEIAERLNLPKRASKASTEFKDAQKTKSEGKKLPETAISKCSKRKIVKEDAASVVQAISEEGLQIEKEVVDPVKAPRKGGHGMVKRNTSAVINQELNMGVTEKKQVIVSSANKAEKGKKARREQNCSDKETAITEVEKGELIDKKGRRANLEARTTGDENIQSRKVEVEDKGKEQKTSFLPVESSKPARRATRSNKSCEVATAEPISVQPLASASLKPASSCPSKRTLRGKRVIAETSDLSPKKSKIEKETGKVTTHSRKMTKAAVNAKKALPVTPQPAKPTGRSTRSRK